MRVCRSAGFHSTFEEEGDSMRSLTPVSVLVFSGLLIIATGGCARSIALAPSSFERPDSLMQSVQETERVPFIMHSFRVLLNGAPQNPSSGLERRILNSVQETQLFSLTLPLGTTQTSSDGKAINARITFEETIDPHSGETALKGILVGASMFLLSPVITLNYDYGVKASLELERWDGQIKRYEARSSGAAQYNLFGATPVLIDELKGRVTEACLDELIHHLLHDGHFYVASSAPLSDSSIRSVTVKAPLPHVQNAEVALPISSTPMP